MSNRSLQYLIAALLGLVVAFYGQQQSVNIFSAEQQSIAQNAQTESAHHDISQPIQTTQLQKTSVQGNNAIRSAYAAQRSDVQVKGRGVVQHVLADDNDGSRHQKFILQLDNGLSVLVAHNIDLAPKIQALQKGDLVGFYGEYEYNAKGGVIHWTHHDPQARHRDGWLQHHGEIYQ